MTGEGLTQLPIPTSPADVDAAWLSRALSADSEVIVADVVHEEIVRGAGTKLRVKVRYQSNPTGLPPLLWVKAGWEEHSPAMERAGVYTREAVFYRDFALTSRAHAPRCFHASWDDSGRSVVILEDLITRGASLWDCRVPRSVADVESLLDTLAQLHARWWEDDALAAMANIDVPVDAAGPTAEWPRVNGGERLRSIIAGERGALMPAYARDAGRIEQAFWTMVDGLGRSQGRCLLHGDPHPGNCFSDADGSAGLYDWQTIACGPWAYDVGYAVVTALEPDQRRASERRLLEQYLDRLRLYGVANPPAIDAAWDDYRRHIAYPLLIWPTNHVSHQSEDNIRALTARLGAAAADFDFFALWGA